MKRRTFLGVLLSFPFWGRMKAWADGPGTTGGPVHPNTQASAPARAAFSDLIMTEARFADTPWALAHGMVAFGAGFKLENGALASDYLGSKFLRDDPAIGAHFDLGGEEGVVGEMHPHLVMKTLVEVDTQPDLRRRLAAAAVKRFRMPATYKEWDDSAWLLWALARMPDFGPETKLGPAAVPLRDVAMGALEQVEQGDKVVEALLASPEGFKRPPGGGSPATSGIWAFSCGGQHLIQAVVVSFGSGVIPASEQKRVAARMETFKRRVHAESLFRDREKAGALKAGVSPPVVAQQHTLFLLKLHGHSLETLARACEAGILDRAATRSEADYNKEQLERIIKDIRAVIVLDKYLPFVRTKDPATWRLWFGDACHSIHGQGMWA